MDFLKNLFLCLFVTAVMAIGTATPAPAQVAVEFGVQPICPYGYYDYEPYECAPIGFYGPGYFYNGIFIGVGPWGGWGYNHGWGGHRFNGGRGGSYHGNAGHNAHMRGNSGRGGNRGSHGGNRGNSGGRHR
jgi:hypothetical protein